MSQPTTTLPTARNGLGTAALVLGIIAAVLGFIPVLGTVSFVLGPLAVILGIIGWTRTRGAAPTANNPVASLIGAGLGAVGFVLALIITVALGAAFSSLEGDLERELDSITAPGAEPATPAEPQEPGTFGGGTHVVGVDIEPGAYRTEGPTSGMPFCYWARLSDTSGSFDSIITNGSPEGPTTVTIDASDNAFETSGCAPWSKVD